MSVKSLNGKQKLKRILVLCPKGHEVITRKRHKIQCRQCGIRFGVPEPKEINN